jgi:SagB-type dehydrogenase family enzyme
MIRSGAVKRKEIIAVLWVITLVLCSWSASFSEELKPLLLPKPQMNGGKPLMDVLKERHSVRQFKADKLPGQVLSNLLWAAFGVNRPEAGNSPSRTAPSARNWQEIDIYVATIEGLYLFDGRSHLLKPVAAGDVRSLIAPSAQKFVADAPVNLIYVADYGRMTGAAESDKQNYSYADAALIAENVYLFCASEGLGTVVRAVIDRPALGKAMGLRDDQKIVLNQPVGYPVKK